MRALRQRLSREDEGAAAVEFALILVPLLTLVFAIIAFGWGLARWVSLTGGAREGVRHLAIYGSSNAPNPSAASGEATALAIAAAPLPCADDTCTATPSAVPCAPGTNVTFDLTMSEFTPMPLPFVPDLSFATTATAVMRCGG